MAQLLELHGPVRLTLPGGEAQPAVAGTPLPGSARLEVGSSGIAVLSLGGARVALGPLSAASFDRDGGVARLSLESGAIAIRGAATPLVQSELAVIAAGAVRIEAGAPGATLVSTSAERVSVYALEGETRLRGPAGAVAMAPGAAWSSSGAAPAAGDAERSLARRLDGLALAPVPPAAPPPEVAAGPAPEAPGPAVQAAAPGGKALQPEAAATVKPRPSRLVARAAVDAQARSDEAIHARAHKLESEGRYAEAAALYRELADGGGARAEPALYELGRLELRFLHQPQAALSALAEHQRRFAGGALALESSLTAIEARLQLGQDEPALREIDGFLARYGESERATEVRWLRASLLQSRGDCAGAAPELRLLAREGARAEEALFLLAGCARQSGDAAEERLRLEEYQRRFPSGRHRAEVDVGLGGGR